MAEWTSCFLIRCIPYRVPLKSCKCMCILYKFCLQPSTLLFFKVRPNGVLSPQPRRYQPLPQAPSPFAERAVAPAPPQKPRPLS